MRRKGETEERRERDWSNEKEGERRRKELLLLSCLRRKERKKARDLFEWREGSVIWGGKMVRSRNVRDGKMRMKGMKEGNKSIVGGKWKWSSVSVFFCICILLFLYSSVYIFFFFCICLLGMVFGSDQLYRFLDKLNLFLQGVIHMTWSERERILLVLGLFETRSFFSLVIIKMTLFPVSLLLLLFSPVIFNAFPSAILLFITLLISPSSI